MVQLPSNLRNNCAHVSKGYLLATEATGLYLQSCTDVRVLVGDICDGAIVRAGSALPSVCMGCTIYCPSCWKVRFLLKHMQSSPAPLQVCPESICLAENRPPFLSQGSLASSFLEVLVNGARPMEIVASPEERF